MTVDIYTRVVEIGRLMSLQVVEMSGQVLVETDF